MIFSLWIVQFYDMYFCNMHYCYRRVVLRLILLTRLLMFRLSRVLPYGVFFSLFSRLVDFRWFRAIHSTYSYINDGAYQRVGTYHNSEHSFACDVCNFTCMVLQ